MRGIALMLALKQERALTFQILLDTKKDVFKFDDYIIQTECIWPYDTQIVKSLVNQLTEGCSNNEERARKLIEFQCPLAPAVWVYEDAELTKLMLDQGCQVDGRLVSTGETALHLAVENLDVDNVKLLVERGAEIDALDNRGCTPLTLFKLRPNHPDRKLDILRLLLDGGASLNAICYNRRCVYNLCAFSTAMSELLSEGDTRILRLLMPYINLHHKDTNGKTPLHHMATNRNAGGLEVMRGKSFDINARDFYGNTPLDLAAIRADSNKVRFLLENGANLSVIGDDPDRVIKELICKVPKSEEARKVLKLLLLYNEDPKLLMKNNFEPTQLAYAMEDDPEFAKLLIAHFAKLHSFGVSLNTFIDKIIKPSTTFEDYFHSYKQQLERMKQITICHSITLHQLLFKSPKTLIMYARNEEFRTNYESIKKTICNICSLYMDLVKLRVDDKIIFVRMESRAVNTVCQMTALPIDISYIIISYLNHSDYKNLSQIFST